LAPPCEWSQKEITVTKPGECPTLLNTMIHTYHTMRRQERQSAYSALATDLERRMVAALPLMTPALAHYLRTTPERRAEGRETLRALSEVEAKMKDARTKDARMICAPDSAYYRCLAVFRPSHGQARIATASTLWQRLALALMKLCRRLAGPALVMTALYFSVTWLLHHGMLTAAQQ